MIVALLIVAFVALTVSNSQPIRSVENNGRGVVKNQFLCTINALNDSDSCSSSQDDGGQSCVFCTLSEHNRGLGLCVSSDQSDLIGLLFPDSFKCGASSLQEFSAPEDIYDLQCLTAGINGGADGQSACDAAQDEDGSPCMWCSAAGVFGLCLTSTQRDAVDDYLQCDDLQDPPLPPDFTECLSLTDEDSCNTSADPKCDWCNTAAGFGVCLSEQAAEIAKSYAPLFQCDGAFTTSHETQITVGDFPDDIPICLAHSEEDDCNSATDATCVWCSAAAYGACLDQEAAEIAKNYAPEGLVTCDDSTVSRMGIDDEQTELQDPLDPTCVLSVQNADQNSAEDVCRGTQDTEGESCLWCTFGDVYGICLTPEQSQIAGAYVTCDSTAAHYKIKSVEVDGLKNPYDPTCTIAAWNADDAKAACAAASDSDGDTCVWCVPPTTDEAGVCLDHEQAEIASQWLSCEMNDDNVVESVATM